jgi:hypothetical protein
VNVTTVSSFTVRFRGRVHASCEKVAQFGPFDSVGFMRASSFAPLLILGSVAATSTLTTETGCSASNPAPVSLITKSIADVLSCVTTSLLTGGVEDPVLIAAACVPATLSDVVAIADAWIAGSGAAGDGGAPPVVASVSDSGAVIAATLKIPLLTPEAIARLKRISARGHALLASGTPVKAL